MNLKTNLVSVFIGIILSAFWLTGCNPGVEPPASPSPAAETAQATPSPTVLPTPRIFTTRIPDVEASAVAFLEEWKSAFSIDTLDPNEFYQKMFARLENDDQAALISQEQFIKAYQNVADEAALVGIDYRITSSALVDNTSATVNYHVTFHSTMLGEIERDMVMPLNMINGAWRIRWNKNLIMPELNNDYRLSMIVDAPTRANIYDRQGEFIAGLAEASAVGLYPDNVKPEMPEGLLSLLSRTSGLPAAVIQGLIDNAYPGTYLPMGEVLTSEYQYILGSLSKYGAVAIGDYKARYYDRGGIAPHVIGYVSAIQKEELSTYRRKGYQIDESIGRKGLERWAEETLTGVHGGTLFVVDTNGAPIAQLGTKQASPGQDITTTLEKDFQAGVQAALRGLKGAAVVMEMNTGRVLAVASSPGFDPNAYQTANINWVASLNDIASNKDLPQYNRATMGQYPLGSVFKVVTMAAALESGYYTADTPYECGYEFNELPGFTRYDWTWEHFQEDGVTKPSGHLNLTGGLIRSCDPFFWHIGLDLFNKGLTKAISDMARAFGLGSLTGIQGVDELAGNIPDPTSQVDALNLAIGQGDMQVTPLQVASFMAAVGNGGTLYVPQIIERIGPSEAPTTTFAPIVMGKLPVKAENLRIIQDAMRGVVTSRTPRGTAYDVFSGFRFALAAKTGTATTGEGFLPHGWFAGYTMVGNADRPDISIAVVIENIGEGSEWAAPVFRRIVELYFNGRPQRLYRWEAALNVTKTPTPMFDEQATPTPEP